MNEIWVNRLIAKTKSWDEMPASRKAEVKLILAERVKEQVISSIDYSEITGEIYDL